MGTNYYLDNEDNKIHIGKSSYKWTFTFHLFNEEIWFRILNNDSQIFNEYGEKISFENFKRLVENKKNSPNKSEVINGEFC